MQDFPRVCGHKENSHFILLNKWNVCEECIKQKGTVSKAMIIDNMKISEHDFKPDNLKYLETLYESRTGRA